MKNNSSLQEFFDAREEEISISCTTNTTRDESFVTAPRDDRSRDDRSARDDRSPAGTAAASGSVAVASVTAAEPIEEDDEDIHLHDYAQIPTIRLSSLGTALEKDFHQVQAELGNSLSTDEEGSGEGNFSDENTHGSNSTDLEKGRYLLNKANSAEKGHVSASDSNPVTPTASEEIVVEDHIPLPTRERTVSHDGVIAEFDLNAGISRGNQSEDDSAPDDVVAEAVEIDASFRSMSWRSMTDLELGDEEPLPYPGRRMSASRSSARTSSEIYTSRNARLMGSAMGRYGRAELLSATVIKNLPTEQIGINLLRDETVVYSIARGEEDEAGSLLQNCPFQAGDRLLSINNKRTQHMDSAEVARILREASGFITIVVHNPSGDPSLIETMITKANKNQRSGMGLKSTGSRDLRVSSINENGLFANSLLNVGDRIISINEVDVTEVDARVACDIIKTASDRVTVVARQTGTTGVVVAEVSTRGLRASFSNEQVLAAVPESGAASNRNEIEAFDDTFQLSKQQREQVMIGTCLCLVVVAVMAGIFGRSPDDDAS